MEEYKTTNRNSKYLSLSLKGITPEALAVGTMIISFPIYILIKNMYENFSPEVIETTSKLVETISKSMF